MISELLVASECRCAGSSGLPKLEAKTDHEGSNGSWRCGDRGCFTDLVGMILCPHRAGDSHLH